MFSGDPVVLRIFIRWSSQAEQQGNGIAYGFVLVEVHALGLELGAVLGSGALHFGSNGAERVGEGVEVSVVQRLSGVVWYDGGGHWKCLFLWLRPIGVTSTGGPVFTVESSIYQLYSDINSHY